MSEVATTRKELVDILVRRDGISEGDALSLIEECADALENGHYNAMQSVLGLEDDYIFAVLDY